MNELVRLNERGVGAAADLLVDSNGWYMEPFYADEAGGVRANLTNKHRDDYGVRTLMIWIRPGTLGDEGKLWGSVTGRIMIDGVERDQQIEISIRTESQDVANLRNRLLEGVMERVCDIRRHVGAAQGWVEELNNG